MIALMKVQLLAARTSSDKREWGSEVSRKSFLLRTAPVTEMLIRIICSRM